MKRLIFYICILCVFYPQQVTAGQDQVPVVLMVPFDNATGKQKLDSLKNGIPDLLTAFLTPYSEQIRVIDRGLIERVFAERSLVWEGFVEEKSITQIGTLMQAKYIVRGSISGGESSFGVNVFLYEIETMRLLKSFEIAERANDITQLAQKIAVMIAQYFQTDIKSVVDLPIEEDPVKNLNLIYGLGYYHSGQFEMALTYFMKILGDNPKDEMAHYWLGKSFLSAGMKDHARIELEEFIKSFPDSEKSIEIKKHLKTLNQEKGVRP